MFGLILQTKRLTAEDAETAEKRIKKKIRNRGFRGLHRFKNIFFNHETHEDNEEKVFRI